MASEGKIVDAGRGVCVTFHMSLSEAASASRLGDCRFCFDRVGSSSIYDMELAPLGGDAFRARLDESAAGLAPSLLKVARYMDRHRARVLAASAAGIAGLAGTSDATVVRTARALGYAGLPELKRALAESLDPPSTPADEMRRTLGEVGADVGHAVDAVLDAQEAALRSLRTPGTRDALAAAVAALAGSERIALFGIGPTAHLVRYAAVPLGRAGRRTLLLDRTGRGRADQLLDLGRGDALLALAYGRPYREIAVVLGEARRLGQPAGLLTGEGDPPRAAQAPVVLAVARGAAGRAALHGGTLAALEALVLGLTAAAGDGALATLDRLGTLRAELDPPRRGRTEGGRRG